MAFPILFGISVVLLIAILGLSALLFGREWIRSARERRFSREVSRHEGIAARLRDPSPEEFEPAFCRLAALDDPGIAEAVLNRAREEAPPDALPRLTRAFEDLGIADRYLRALTESTSWEERARAAERLGHIGSVRAVPVLLQSVRDVRDEDEDVRGAALRALGRIRDPRAIPGLIEALGVAESFLPPRIAEILVRFGAEAVPALIAELGMVERDVRRMWAAEILGWIADPRAAVPLIESLGDVNPEVRAKAAGALGKLGESRAVDRLLEMLLSDPIPFVRTRVAQALGAIGHPKVIDHLIHVLKDPEWWVRIRAIEALEQIGTPSVGALLVALEDEDPEVSRRAATALERMGHVRECIAAMERDGFRPDLSKVLVLIGRTGVTEVLFDTLPRAKGKAPKLLVRLAGDIGDPAAGPVLMGLLRSAADPSFRSRIVEAIGKVRYREAAPEILECLRDPDDWVRRASVEALAAFGPSQYLEELARLLRDPSPSARKAVCRVLGQVEDERTPALLDPMLSDPAPEVRAEALRSVARRSVPGSGPRIASLLFDPSAEVRLEAARALAATGGAGEVEPILRAAAQASEPMREALTEALAHCHPGTFGELLPAVQDRLTGDQVLLLLEAASRGTGAGRLEFIAGHLHSPDPVRRRAALSALRGFEAGDVLEPLREAGTDPDDRVREAAVTVAAMAGIDPLGPETGGLLRDPCEGVRFRMALAVGLLGGEAGREPLSALTRDHAPAVRAAAALALAIRGDPALAPEIRSYFEDEELLEAGRKIFVDGSKDPLVSRVMEEASREGRFESRLFLGGSRYALEKEMARRARTALTEEERLRYLELCGVLVTGQSYTTVLAILKNDPSPAVRARALDLLVRIRDDREVAGIVGSILLDPHPALRTRAATILGDLEYPEAIEALVHALDTSDRELREAVTTSLSGHLHRDPDRMGTLLREIPSTKTRKLGMVWLLGKNRGEGAMGMLLRYLEDGDGDVRASAVGALAKYRLGIVARHLRRALSDPSGRVRAAAVNALAGMRQPEWEETMEGMLADPDPYVRRRAALALVRMDSDAATKRIRAMAREPEELRPVWSAGGLFRGLLSFEEASPVPGTAGFLRELCSEEEAESAACGSPDPERRLAMFRVLRVLSPEAGIRTARRLTEDPEPSVRREAERVLPSAE